MAQSNCRKSVSKGARHCRAFGWHRTGGEANGSVEDIRWSDIILVMEDKHKSRLLAQFRDEVRYKALHVLDIPDEYKYMDPELVEIIRETATPIILDARP